MTIREYNKNLFGPFSSKDAAYDEAVAKAGEWPLIEEIHIYEGVRILGFKGGIVNTEGNNEFYYRYANTLLGHTPPGDVYTSWSVPPYRRVDVIEYVAYNAEAADSADNVSLLEKARTTERHGWKPKDQQYEFTKIMVDKKANLPKAFADPTYNRGTPNAETRLIVAVAKPMDSLVGTVYPMLLVGVQLNGINFTSESMMEFIESQQK